MYRATRKRDEMGFNSTKGVGHVHISSKRFPNEYFDVITNIITNATK